MNSPIMELTFSKAVPGDAPEIAALHTAVARALTRRFSSGRWSREPSEHGVLYDMRISRVWIARRVESLVATFRLATKKPWAIDRSCFTPAERPVYLTEMAVQPALQRQGIGTRCVDEIFIEVGRVTYRKVPLIYFEATVQSDVRLRP